MVPAPAFRTLTEAGAPAWAVETFERLRAANDGKLSGFFDVFAWRPPGEVRFMEIKVAKDKVQPTQRRFVERALRFHDQKQFMIVEVPARYGPLTSPPSPDTTGFKPAGTAACSAVRGGRAAGSAADVELAVALGHWRPPQGQHPREQAVTEVQAGHPGEDPLRPADHPAGPDIVGRAVPGAHQAAVLVDTAARQVSAEVPTAAGDREVAPAGFPTA